MSRQGFLSGDGDEVVVVLGFYGGGVAEGSVEPVVVQPVDPGQGGQLEVVDGAERAVVADALVLYSPMTVSAIT